MCGSFPQDGEMSSPVNKFTSQGNWDQNGTFYSVISVYI